MNIGSLRCHKKQNLNLAFLKSLNMDIIGLQETHLLHLEAQHLKRSWVAQIFSNNFSSYKDGTLILIAKSFLGTFSNTYYDPRDFMLVHIYAPNSNTTPLLAEVAAKLATFHGEILWLGDFNLPFSLLLNRDFPDPSIGAMTSASLPTQSRNWAP